MEHLPSQAGGRGEGGSGAADPDSVLTSRARRREQKSFHISKVTDADRAGRFHRMRRRLRLQVELQELLEDPLELYRMKSGPNRSAQPPPPLNPNQEQTVVM